MFQNTTIWTLAYLADTAFLVASVLLFWDGLKNYLLKKSIRKLVFGSGLLVLSFSYLVICIYNSQNMPPLITVPMIVGFNLILWSLIRKKWELVFLVLNILPLLIAVNSAYAFGFAAIPLVLAVLAYRNCCLEDCPGGPDDCAGVQKSNKNIAVLFIIMAVNIILTIPAQGGYYLISSPLMMYGIIATEALMAAIIFGYVMKRSHFNQKEKLMIPILVGFIILLSFVGFYSNQKIRFYNQEQLKTLSLKETKSALLITESYLADDDLAQLVADEDVVLNDVADRILIETGIRTTFFKGNRRIAASLSSAGGGRYLGTLLNDPETEKKVLEEGVEAMAKIRKNNQELITSYIPIKKDGQTIGMIGTGILMTNYYRDQDSLMFKIATITLVAFVTVFVVMAHETTKQPKKKK